VGLPRDYILLLLWLGGVSAHKDSVVAIMGPTDVDYSLYLVTDSTPEILGDKDLVAVVEAALKGGVTLVQYRDKVSDTGPCFPSFVSPYLSGI
jgi:hypothetical protein